MQFSIASLIALNYPLQNWLAKDDGERGQPALRLST